MTYQPDTTELRRLVFTAKSHLDVHPDCDKAHEEVKEVIDMLFARVEELEGEIQLITAPKEAGGGYEMYLERRLEELGAEKDRLLAVLDAAKAVLDQKGDQH